MREHACSGGDVRCAHLLARDESARNGGRERFAGAGARPHESLALVLRDNNHVRGAAVSDDRASEALDDLAQVKRWGVRLSLNPEAPPTEQGRVPACNALPHTCRPREPLDGLERRRVEPAAALGRLEQPVHRYDPAAAGDPVQHLERTRVLAAHDVPHVSAQYAVKLPAHLGAAELRYHCALKKRPRNKKGGARLGKRRNTRAAPLRGAKRRVRTSDLRSERCTRVNVITRLASPAVRAFFLCGSPTALWAVVLRSLRRLEDIARSCDVLKKKINEKRKNTFR